MDRLDTYLRHDGVRVETGTADVDGGKLIIRKSADIEPNVEYARAIGNDLERWKAGVRSGWAHSGHIPAITVVELLGIGVDVYTATLPEIRAGLKKLGKEGFIWKT